ncbi:hypothetical protein B0T22DRAFT_496441 [Podospora appendiculata]|uniref:EGF-like domain-containing protein n=1 Tax=Podospora appendiculata TaxID=314037 RepID=A0AAE0XID8_9PEZI|nr:hypothetical protein B0T22DRAFT_496441 [Podospora appendiculata]
MEEIWIDHHRRARPSVARQAPVIPSAGSSRLPRRPPPPPGFQTKDGQIGVAISKPTQIPQWPLGAVMAPGSGGAEPYRPPLGKSQPPQRPPRPSRVPSMLDSSKVQDHTPVFQYTPQSRRESAGPEFLLVPETPSSMSRPSTLSSVVSIPDFPLPAQLPAGPPRRSVTLGPPPSARRGASSFYSNASYVSPIPEESPRSRSHTSFASSAAIPESWGSQSPGPSPNYPEEFYDDTIDEEDVRETYGDDDAEESRLVRNASLGKRARPTLVSATTPRVMERGDLDPRPGPAPVQSEPFKNGTGYVENSSSSSSLPTTRIATASALTADAILDAYSSASATDPSTASIRASASPQPPPGGRAYSRLSAIRRPPRLDLDAVKKAESRGSLTSLPDLIRRATRLAASLESGRRPASQFEDFLGQDAYNMEKEISLDGEKHQSGLSDMLAAFPPPVHAITTNSRRSFRNSIREQVQSWPIPFNSNRGPNILQDPLHSSGPRSPQSKEGRRCCGLPLWGFIVVMIVILTLIAAAVVIPLEFFVIRKQNQDQGAQAALQQCQQQLTCANGGTNVVNQGTCSCICSNGFTGSDCTVAGTTGCTTISLTGVNTISNVTIGDAIPRLIQQSQANFSIPLSASEILAKFSAGNLSCSAENALVTFDGYATRQGAALAEVSDPSSGLVNAQNVINGVAFTTVTLMAGQFTTITLEAPTGPAAAAPTESTIVTAPSTFVTTISIGRASTTPAASPSPSPTSTSTMTTTMTLTSGTPAATASFTVTEEVLDFARVAVLFILQEESLSDAETAQSTLQRFFTSASSGSSSTSSNSVNVETAQNVTLGNGNSIDLVGYGIMAGRSGMVVASRECQMMSLWKG